MKLPYKKIIWLFYFCNLCTLFCTGELSGQKIEPLNKFTNYKWEPCFPKAFFIKNSPYENQEKQLLYSVNAFSESENKQKLLESKLQSVLLNNDIFALYGKPEAYTMGILGQYKLEQLDPIISQFIKMYDEINGDRNIIPALYIIYGTCWPKGEIGLLPLKTTEKYIQYAAERGWYVYLDHQIGKYTVEQAMNKILPFLRYDNVHLALDPEWRTTRPMRVIGSVTADEINKAQEMMNQYIIDNGISGRRMLVIHQFNAAMIQNRSKVRSNYKMVQLIHCTDGFGSPKLKKETYKYTAAAQNIPIKSFKLFLKPKVAGAGYDNPLMKPEEVLKLNPRPYLIMYQ